MNLKTLALPVIMAGIMTGCATRPTVPEPLGFFKRVPATYVVQRGDTLSAIARQYGLDYRELGKINQLDSRYTIYVGQQLRLKGSAPAVTSRPMTAQTSIQSQSMPRVNVQPAPAPAPAPVTQTASSSSQWLKPVNGPLIASFNKNAGVQGNRYAGALGDPVVAARSGEVIYASNGLKEYGNLILVRHDNEFISAYAHNQVMLVKDGDKVNQGQKIATLGQSGTTRPMLEFQIRKSGVAVDPSELLR